MLTYEQTEQQANRFFSYLRNNKQEALLQYFCNIESILMDKDTAYFVVQIGFERSVQAGVFSDNDKYGALATTKEGFDFVLENSPSKIVLHVLPVLFQYMLTFGDFDYALKLLNNDKDKILANQVQVIFTQLIDNLLQKLNDVDFDDDTTRDDEKILQDWERILEVLHVAGLPHNLDIGKHLVSFVPEFPGDEAFYMNLLTFFIRRGFVLQSGMPALENPIFNSVALHDKLLEDMTKPVAEVKKTSFDGKI